MCYVLILHVYKFLNLYKPNLIPFGEFEQKSYVSYSLEVVHLRERVFYLIYCILFFYFIYLLKLEFEYGSLIYYKQSIFSLKGHGTKTLRNEFEL